MKKQTAPGWPGAEVAGIRVDIIPRGRVLLFF